MFKNRFTAVKAMLVSGAIAAGSSAMAALPPDASTAMADYKTDALTALGLVIAAGIAIYGLKKLGAKLGWL